jgi:hypothetical protein
MMYEIVLYDRLICAVCAGYLGKWIDCRMRQHCDQRGRRKGEEEEGMASRCVPAHTVLLGTQLCLIHSASALAAAFSLACCNLSEI